MAAQPEYLNEIEREAIYRMRELFAQGRETTVNAGEEDADTINKWAELALYPEKPILSFLKKEVEEEAEQPWNPERDAVEFFRLAEKFHSKARICKLITCGGVDDGKSTLIGRILYDTKSKTEQEAINNNPLYLRKDGTVDYALLAGTTEEEARQGITVQVSHSVFDWSACSYLMADVPGHEEYTRNMAYAATRADTAIIIVAANKGIVPQTKRHTRICNFMGIRSMVFAVNKMDMVSFRQDIFEQISQEVAQLMEDYPECTYEIVPVAAKSGVNITEPAVEIPWYQDGSLLDVIVRIHQKKQVAREWDKHFCMPVQRICKSSQMKDAQVKKRAIQGEVLSGELKIGDEIYVYPTTETAKVTAIYNLNEKTDNIYAGASIGVELDRELDVARGYIIAKEDILTSTDRMEVGLLWTSDNRLTQGKRYQIKIGTTVVTATVTKIYYQVDVNTGEHRYTEHLTKNALARCELCLSKPVPVTCEEENRSLGTFRLIDRETSALAAYGNIIKTISEDAWKEDGRTVTAEERETALGQKAGILLFSGREKSGEQMNYAERYLLRMGFHTIQFVVQELDKREVDYIKCLLHAGLIVLVEIEETEKNFVKNLVNEKSRCLDCSEAASEINEMGNMLKRMKQWAAELI